MFRVKIVALLIAMSVSLSAKLVVPGSLSAHFVHIAGGTRTSGTIYINRSRAFKLNVSRPAHMNICNLKSTVEVVNRDQKSVINYDVGSFLDMMQVLKVAEHYKGNLYKSRYHGYHFILRVNARGEVNKITFRDKNGQNNTVVFSAIHYYKKPMSSSRFRCVAPRSYRRIKGHINI